MTAKTLLEDLRSRDVVLRADGDNLRIDAPSGVLTDQLRDALMEHKPRLIKLLTWERRKLEEADRRGLVIRWSEHPGYITLHDPLTGEWHDFPQASCLPGVVETARTARRNTRGGTA